VYTYNCSSTEGTLNVGTIQLLHSLSCSDVMDANMYGLQSTRISTVTPVTVTWSTSGEVRLQYSLLHYLRIVRTVTQVVSNYFAPL
jgi:hypothetical protein